MRIKRIHHLTLAVRDLDGARVTFQQLFGAPPVRSGDIPAFGVRAVDLPLGESVLQLVSPVEHDNPVMRFLERKGEGFYNLAVEVEDLDAAVAELSTQGVRVSEPIESEPGMRSAFVTMTATHGLSVQLVEVAASASSAASPQWAPPATPASEPVPPPDAGELPSEPAPPLDLTPDEWSDLD
jgi:methylmalonyl-CoA epimerase